MGNDFSVHQHKIGIGRQEQILCKSALVGINDRKGGAGRVGGSDRRANGDRDPGVVRRGLGRVENLAAADADHHVKTLFLYELYKAIDLRPRAFAVEFLKDDGSLALGKALFDPLADAADAAGGNQAERLASELGRIHADVVHRSTALNITRRRNNRDCHAETSFSFSLSYVNYRAYLNKGIAIPPKKNRRGSREYRKTPRRVSPFGRERIFAFAAKTENRVLSGRSPAEST